MQTRNVKVALRDGEMGAYLALPDRAPAYIEHHIREAPNLHRPFVLHMALRDRWVQAEVNELLERRLSPNPLVTIQKYPGADHAFARLGGKTYSKPEADRALELTLDFFGRHLA
jgi:carboxymethylenebutenolidase